MKSTLLYFNYFKKRIIKSQAATQSYEGPKSANNSAQAYTNVIYIYIYIYFFFFALKVGKLYKNSWVTFSGKVVFAFASLSKNGCRKTNL